ncbi:MAG: DUF4954 family protein [Fibrobacter sp.]|nr:DUF4954 family protein [Fibrobacter sp.]
MIPTDLHPFVQQYAPSLFSSIRLLTTEERTRLIDNGNSAESWDTIGVINGFDPSVVKNSRFFGCVIIGYQDHATPRKQYLLKGIYHSTIGNSIIGNNVVLNNVGLCNFYYISDNVTLSNVGEINTTPNARFGCGGLLNGNRTGIDLINENGGRSIIPFPDITCSDAFIVAKFKGDSTLQQRFSELADVSCITHIAGIGIIGKHSIVKNVTAIKDCCMGDHTIIDGALLLDNSTIRSIEHEKTSIGHGVQIRDSIVGYGNHIDSASQLTSVISGECVSIHQCARISHSFIGDNSAIGCCEIAHSLIFPSHGEHHNNSFLIASMIGGQSNIAAGATIGSNHNSRTNDGELWASRGFWPGLCTSFKHNSKFASFILCAKSDYPAELCIPFPFSLICNDLRNDTLVIYPAYYFTYNMYAFIRSKVKFIKRDKRALKEQHIEHDPLAPDTIEEILTAISILEFETGRQWFENQKLPLPAESECRKKGREILLSNSTINDICIKGTFEKSNRPVVIRKVAESWKMYHTILRWYCASEIIYYYSLTSCDFSILHLPARKKKWVNCGGQIISQDDLDLILDKIKNTVSIHSWKDVHTLFTASFDRYKEDRFKHALATLAYLEFCTETDFSLKEIVIGLQKTIPLLQTILDLIAQSRKKDYTDPFRTMVYDSSDELTNVLGDFEQDTVISDLKAEIAALENAITAFTAQSFGNA